MSSKPLAGRPSSARPIGALRKRVPRGVYSAHRRGSRVPLDFAREPMAKKSVNQEELDTALARVAELGLDDGPVYGVSTAEAEGALTRQQLKRPPSAERQPIMALGA